MKMHDLQRVIARNTGDSLRTIKRLGFQFTLITPPASSQIPNAVQNTIPQYQKAKLVSKATDCELVQRLVNT